jgi:hypothetical protein
MKNRGNGGGRNARLDHGAQRAARRLRRASSPAAVGLAAAAMAALVLVTGVTAAVQGGDEQAMATGKKLYEHD